MRDSKLKLKPDKMKLSSNKHRHRTAIESQTTLQNASEFTPLEREQLKCNSTDSATSLPANPLTLQTLGEFQTPEQSLKLFPHGVNHERLLK